MQNTALILGLTLMLPMAQAHPLAVKGPLAIAEVMLNGKGPFRMVIDTGASSCSFTSAVAKVIGAKPEFRVVNITPGNSTISPATGAIEVAMGNRVESGVQFYWQDSYLSKELGLDVVGVLGQSFLSRFDYTLDYQARQIVIGEPAPSRRKPGMRLAFERAEGRMIVRASNREDGQLRLVLDSGASNLSLWHSSIRRGHEVGTAVTYAGRQTVALGKMAYLELGEKLIANIDVVIPGQESAVTREDNGEDGLLPAALFRSVYVSNSQSFVELTR